MRCGPMQRLRQRCCCSGDQSGQAILWVAVMLPLFLSMVGLAIDGGIVFTARLELQNVADSAARAGAMQVDERVYRESSGATVILDITSARYVAAEYVASQGVDMGATVVAEPRRVVVRVTRDVATSFLRIAGINRVRIAATAPADVQYGIDRANR